MMISTHRLAFGDFQLDPATGDLHGPSGLVPLQPKVLALLGYLATHPGRLVSKRELLDAVWPDVFVTDAVLKVGVRQIRQALGDDAHEPRFVETAHRRGYRFVAPVRHVPATGAVSPVTPVEPMPIVAPFLGRLQGIPVSVAFLVARGFSIPVLLARTEEGQEHAEES